MTPFIIAYYISLVKVQDNYCNYNLLILDVKQLHNIIKLYYRHTLKALWNDQDRIKMYYGMSRIELRCIMECPGLKSNYREKVLFFNLWTEN